MTTLHMEVKEDLAGFLSPSCFLECSDFFLHSEQTLFPRERAAPRPVGTPASSVMDSTHLPCPCSQLRWLATHYCSPKFHAPGAPRRFYANREARNDRYTNCTRLLKCVLHRPPPQTALTEYRLKNKIITTFRTSAAEHESKPRSCLRTGG